MKHSGSRQGSAIDLAVTAKPARSPTALGNRHPRSGTRLGGCSGALRIMPGNAPGDDRITKGYIALVLVDESEHVQPLRLASLVPDKLAKGRRNVVPVPKARSERTVGVLASALVLVGGRKALQLAARR